MQRTPESRQGDYPGAAGAIVVAAGRSLRMGGLDKIMAPLLGKPLVLYSLEAFNASPAVSVIVLVVAEHNLEACRRIVDENGLDKVIDVRVGAGRRQDSVRIGLDGMPDPGSTIVHDGARPCVDAATIARGVAAVHRHGAAIAAVPVKDTIKLAARDRRVLKTIDRDGLWAAQTPQVFRTAVLRDAHDALRRRLHRRRRDGRGARRDGHAVHGLLRQPQGDDARGHGGRRDRPRPQGRRVGR